jgi:CubicO group peptidase (beta-lactamase class C family)
VARSAGVAFLSINNKLNDCLNTAISRQVFPGCALAYVRGGESSVVTAGRLTYDDDAAPVTESTVYDCASITKAIPVSNLALWLIDRGRLRTDSRLIDFVPEYVGSFRDAILIRHLLTHTLDFDFRLSEYKDLPPEELLRTVLGVKMKGAPGEKFCYSNAASILLGLVVERASGRPLHTLAQEVFFDPLGMVDTTFFIDGGKRSRCAPTEIDPWRGRAVCGEVHDESACTLQKFMTPGSAGLFSTAGDLLKYIIMLIDGWGDFFSAETMESMQTDQIPNISDACTGLGWELNQEYMGKNRTPETFGKTGFTGCAVVVDRPGRAGFALLSNCTWPRRKPNRDMINEVRAEVGKAVLERKTGGAGGTTV